MRIVLRAREVKLLGCVGWHAGYDQAPVADGCSDDLVPVDGAYLGGEAEGDLSALDDSAVIRQTCVFRQASGAAVDSKKAGLPFDEHRAERCRWPRDRSDAGGAEPLIGVAGRGHPDEGEPRLLLFGSEPKNADGKPATWCPEETREHQSRCRHAHLRRSGDTEPRV